MPVGRGAVAGLLERAQQLDADRITVLAGLQVPQQLDHLGPVREVAHLEAVGRELLPQGAELLGVRLVVHARHVGHGGLVEGLGHALVGHEHELLDELVGRVVLDHLGAVRPAVLVHVDLDLLHVEVQRPLAEAFGAELGGHRPQVGDHPAHLVELGVAERGQRASRRPGLVRGRRGEGSHGRVVVAAEEGERLLVGEALAAADDRVGEVRAQQARVGVELADHRLDQPVLRLDERAEAAGERVGQHRDDRADQVGRVAPFMGLDVEGRARTDVVGDVGHVDADAQASVGQTFHGERVVEVLGVVRVDGDGRDRAEVLAAGEVGGPHRVAEGRGLRLDRGRELRPQAVTSQDREVFGHRRVRRAEHLGDRAGRAEVATFPGVEPHHDLVLDLGDGRESAPGGVAHHDLSGDPGVVGQHVPLEAVAEERAGQLRERASHDAHHRAGAPVLAHAVASHRVGAHQHAVAVQRDVGVGGVDVQLVARPLAGLGVEDHARRAARTEEDRALQQPVVLDVGAGKREQHALLRDDGAGLEQARHHLAQLGQLPLASAEGVHDGLEAHRAVAGTGQELEQRAFGAHLRRPRAGR